MQVAIDISKLHEDSAHRGIGVYANELIKRIPHVDSKDADIIHFPHFDLFFLSLPLRKTAKWVVTVHDVIPLIFPKHFPPGLRGTIKFHIQKHLLHQADAIITDSLNSKKDIIKHLHIPAQKIHVIYLGVSEAFHPLKIAKKPFILYVGDINYNKNIPSLLEAFAALHASDWQLVLAGQAWKQSIPEVASLHQKIIDLGIKNQVKTMSPTSTNELIRLYNQATLYIQPSLYEGFGLPILEAMACGTPVVSSNAASLPEVSGNAAIMVKPTVTDILAGLRQGLTLSPKQRNSYSKSGLAQAAKFTWAKTAQETIKVYNQVLGY